MLVVAAAASAGLGREWAACDAESGARYRGCSRGWALARNGVLAAAWPYSRQYTPATGFLVLGVASGAKRQLVSVAGWPPVKTTSSAPAAGGSAAAGLVRSESEAQRAGSEHELRRRLSNACITIRSTLSRRCHPHDSMPQPGRLRQLWYRWKALDLPWRKQWLRGALPRPGIIHVAANCHC